MAHVLARRLQRVAATATATAAAAAAAAQLPAAFTSRAARAPLPRVTHFRAMSIAGGGGGGDDSDSIDVWTAVRVLRDTGAETAHIVAAIDAVRVDAVEPLEKQRQALAVVESDALAALLDLLRDADSTAASALLVPAFLALIRLASQPLAAQELLRLDAPTLMTHFLALPDPRLQAAASLLLGIIALDPAAEHAVSDPLVLESVLQLLASPHEAIQRAGATCVANIAGHRLARERLCESEALATLSAMLSAEYSDALRSAAAFALGNILSGRDISAQDTVRENGALAELVMLLSPAFSEEVGSSAAWAIHHAVFLNQESQSLVAEAGGLGLLVKHLSAVTLQLQTNVLLALASCVEGHTQNRAWCCANGVVELLQQVEEDDGEDMDDNARRALTLLLQELA